MAGKIKCSYEDCYRHFKSYEAMIQHKIKEPAHEYCKRCDVDCEDDVAFLIHQMNNPKHIACCICGEEFRSEAGRDAHVELYHQRSQNLPCPGCQMVFPRAGSLMNHIEKDECKVISAEVFERRRAEKQIEKDAWAEALDSTNTRSLLPSQAGVGSETDTNGGGVSLLDDLYSSGLDWQGATPQMVGATPLQPTTSGQYTAPRPLVQSMGALSLDKFPSLPAPNQGQVPKSTSTENSTNSDDLLSFDDVEVKTNILAGGPWNSKTAPISLFTESRLPPLETADADGGSSLDKSSNLSRGTRPNQPISMFDRLSQVSIATSNLPTRSQSIRTASPLPNNNPNARIRTISAALAPKSTLDPWKYFDSLTNAFVCPGAKCGGKYATPKEFQEHLSSSAHVGAKAVCPSCLSKFKSTAALISHCESGSKKCTIRKSANYNQVMQELTAGMLGTQGHLIDGSVKYVANKPEDW